MDYGLFLGITVFCAFLNLALKLVCVSLMSNGTLVSVNYEKSILCVYWWRYIVPF